MEPLRDRAIVLKSIPYEDRHRVVTALTESHGKVTALARNSIHSRRFGGTLEPFAASEWFFTQKPGADMLSLSEAKILRSYDGIRKDIERLTLASSFNEILLKVSLPGDSQRELFKLHSNALLAVEELTDLNHILPLLNAFLAKVLQWCGNQPLFHLCRSCEKSLGDAYSEIQGKSSSFLCLIQDAGWLCRSCEESSGLLSENKKIRIDALAMKDFYTFMNTPIRQALDELSGTKEIHADLFEFLEALVMYHIPGFDRAPIKSFEILKAL